MSSLDLKYHEFTPEGMNDVQRIIAALGKLRDKMTGTEQRLLDALEQNDPYLRDASGQLLDQSDLEDINPFLKHFMRNIKEDSRTQKTGPLVLNLTLVFRQLRRTYSYDLTQIENA